MLRYDPDGPAVDPALMDDAVAFARDAGERTLAWFRSADLAVEAKGDGTPVTAADRAAERRLRELLAERYPADAILGEEEGESAGTSGRRWILDPIDGTKAFTHGVPLYSTLVAVEDEAGLAVGVIHLPALGETVWAGRGRGCHSDRGPARAATRPTLAGAYVTTSGLGSWPAGALDRLHDAGAVLRTWGDAYGYTLVATGRVDAMIDPAAAVWDLAPVGVILGESGGRFSDWAGDGRVDGGNGVATGGGPFHDALLAVLNGTP